MAFYLEGWKRYLDFGSRSRRSAYWFFVLFNLIAIAVLSFLDGALGMRTPTGTGILGTLYMLAVLIPSLAVAVRRLHDTGRSGWWLLLSFVPLIGTIILIIWFATDGQPGGNAYGTNPKAVAVIPPA